MPRLGTLGGLAALALALSSGPALGFGVTSVDDTTTTMTTTTTTTTTNADDGSAAGIDQCFIVGGDCASCCGACTITTDLSNQGKDSCVCYEASTAPSDSFYGTNNNDCVFIEADDVRLIYVRNQCLEGAEEVLAPPRRGS